MTSVGNDNSGLYSKADMVVGVDAGSCVDEIIYDFKMMAVMREPTRDYAESLFDDQKYFILHSFSIRLIRLASIPSLKIAALTVQLLRLFLSMISSSLISSAARIILFSIELKEQHEKWPYCLKLRLVVNEQLAEVYPDPIRTKVLVFFNVF